MVRKEWILIRRISSLEINGRGEKRCTPEAQYASPPLLYPAREEHSERESGSGSGKLPLEPATTYYMSAYLTRCYLCSIFTL